LQIEQLQSLFSETLEHTSSSWEAYTENKQLVLSILSFHLCNATCCRNTGGILKLLYGWQRWMKLEHYYPVCCWPNVTTNLLTLCQTLV